ncbi:ABC-F family ATP-binding cassette domain-containing protein [Terricaulis silvestris]|uniref:ABC transporter ATP-binding protein uup n=1 Tax=Terricaulis silvestris TaxID=2686094 RepID=A0A6I6MND1_9CAUL|nr:ABC-F family ATP-binding cassette domain-containing protein [Terricaulis silvestris]QGZ95591.1 ABC transporter ATP-binding protein uup [Terricaulis silvestris]
MAGPALAHAKDLRLTLGSAPLFEGVSFVLHKGECAALIGANGAGKSTLIRMLAGEAEPDSGIITYASGTVVALARQEPDMEGFATLRDYARAPSVSIASSDRPAPAHDADSELELFGLDPYRAPTGLSGGETRRASLARAFAAGPDILLLDEPTNHLDIAAIELLEQRVAAFNGACLIVSHDRRFLERVTTATLWLRQRRVLTSDEGYAQFESWAERIEVEEERYAARLETHLKAEEHWLRRGVTARRSRNEGRRRKLEAMRTEKRDFKALSATPKAALQADKGAESSKLVIEAKRVSIAYGRPIVTDFSTRIMRGDRVGVVGANGAGKTTLLELLLQRRDPESGEVRLGGNLEIAYVDQSRAILGNAGTIWDALAPRGGDQIMVRGRPKHVAAYAGEFLFSPAQLRQPIDALSGGERNRLALAVALAKPANLLVLDEPTNDLDIDTLDALEDMLAAYDGTVILVSHDRAFLDGVATQIIGPLGDGKWVEAPGGWSDFEREYGGVKPKRREQPAAQRAEPKPQAPRKATKLSYKDERRAAELDTLLPKLSAEIGVLEASLAASGVFERDPKAFHTTAARLEAARAEHIAGEGEWLEIELKREALASEE